MTEAPAHAERVDHALVLTINRPEARNAVNAEVAAIFGEALDDAERDPGVRVVVLTGAGDKAFCAGADLKAIARGESLYPVGREEFGFGGWVNRFVSKPTIAAVNGLALGGGTELVLASDLVVAAANASFGLPEVKRGVIAAAGGAFRIVEQLPTKVALHVLMTGESIDAATAERWGLINSVVPEGEALSRALELAERLAANSPTAVQASKRVAYRAADGSRTDERERWAHLQAENLMVRASADGQEGPRAFAEKRAPIWAGN